MRKLIDNIRVHYKAYLITLLVSAVVGVGIFLIFYFVGKQTLVASIDGTGVTFMILFGISILLLIGQFGAFDIFVYGTKQMFAGMFSKNPNKYNDYASYREERYAKREKSPKIYFAIMLVSFLFLIVFAILEIIKFSIYH